MSTRECFRFLFKKNYGVYGSLLLVILLSIKSQNWLTFMMFLSLWFFLMTIYMLLVCFVHEIKDKKVLSILVCMSLLAIASGVLSFYLLLH